jgi:hypothetical protein
MTHSEQFAKTIETYTFASSSWTVRSSAATNLLVG